MARYGAAAEVTIKSRRRQLKRNRREKKTYDVLRTKGLSKETLVGIITRHPDKTRPCEETGPAKDLHGHADTKTLAKKKRREKKAKSPHSCEMTSKRTDQTALARIRDSELTSVGSTPRYTCKPAPHLIPAEMVPHLHSTPSSPAFPDRGTDGPEPLTTRGWGPEARLVSRNADISPRARIQLSWTTAKQTVVRVGAGHLEWGV